VTPSNQALKFFSFFSLKQITQVEAHGKMVKIVTLYSQFPHRENFFSHFFSFSLKQITQVGAHGKMVKIVTLYSQFPHL
jgi:hypothetical protein